MSSTRLLSSQQQHRKKKYVFKEREAPFPVPIASITREASSKNYWYHYTGQIQGDHVLVTHSGDISYLNRMGFFGRGLTSRGAPAVYKDLPYVHLPSARDNEPDIVRVMRRRMYLKHMKWRKSHDQRATNKTLDSGIGRDSETPEDEEFDSDLEYFHPDYAHRDDMMTDNPHSGTEPQKNMTSVKETVAENSSAVDDNDIPIQQSNSQSCSSASANQNTVWSWNEESSNQKTSNDLWDNSASNQNVAADAWDKMEADEDFWGSEDLTTKENKLKGKSPNVRGETVLNNSDENDIETIGKKRGAAESDSSFDSPVKKIKLSSESDLTGSNEKVDQSGCVSLQQSRTDDSKNETEIDNKTSEEPEKKRNENQEKTKDDVQERETMKKHGQNEEHKERNNEKVTPVDSDNAEKISNSHADSNEMDKNLPELPIHPYCRNDDDDDNEIIDNEEGKIAVAGDEYLVIDDSDIDDSAECVRRKEKYTWIPVRKREIFNFNEPLVLSFEEAYFLCYGLGCLTVQDENQTSLTLTDLWCRFCNKPQFLPRYVAYHYFRSKGWVPKPSILFGTDFIVYKVGPEFFHASYSVIVKTVYAGTFEEVEGYNNRKLTWTNFFGLNRVTEHVAKTLVYCYIIMPRDLSEADRKSPECIARFKVRLQTVQRWVSSQERDKEKVEDDIT